MTTAKDLVNEALGEGVKGFCTTFLPLVSCLEVDERDFLDSFNRTRAAVNALLGSPLAPIPSCPYPSILGEDVTRAWGGPLVKIVVGAPLPKLPEAQRIRRTFPSSSSVSHGARKVNVNGCFVFVFDVWYVRKRLTKRTA
jgi:hypothetical protein